MQFWQGACASSYEREIPRRSATGEDQMHRARLLRPVRTVGPLASTRESCSLPEALGNSPQP
jgi:hypothetical protein